MSNVQPGTVMVDRYRLTRPAATDLAEAEAWEAQDQILDRGVRVTFVTGPNAPAAMDAARRAALVADPRLCRVLDVGSTDLGDGEKSYVITEPYAGESLTQIVSRGLVDAQQARALVGEAATALEAARQRGVHHLALRPEAVRVDGHRVVVTGLGIDAGLAGVEASDVDAGATDARGLVALGYYALTARWPGEPLDNPWIATDAVRPLPAQGDADGAVPLSSLVPHVDPELDALARRTFGAGDDVPAGPGDVIAALEPWGQVSVMAALPQFVQPTPDRPVRASVLGTGSTGESRPGTPPPAPPVRRPSTTGRIARAGAVGAVAGAAYGQAAPTAAYSPAGYGTPPTAPPAPAPYGQQPAPQPAYAAQPVQGQQHAPVPAPPGGYGAPPAPPSSGSPTTGSFASTAAPKRRGVNPTPIVLGIILVLVVIAAVWAVGQAVRPFDAPPPVAETSESAAPTDGATEGSEATPTEEETPEVRPIIDTGAVVALEGEADKPEAAELAYDSDPSTFWYTYTYRNNPVFGGYKQGLGYEIRLRENAPVSRVDLLTNSDGGHWELRNTDADDPSGGDLLAEGSFESETAIKLDEPVILGDMVLWITELPTTDGDYRLELNEITLS
ncbi:hypothetical protein ATJ88_0039 [Isoptericola jiangsuensis]|uniref:Protein kinase domain-containing protein n=1 Tax=Isoptericola jiangsuensis TaxID=548579 RepID=A0A2A9EQY3_9MICO|nr:hypothetical protein [Isoptericola jiangsuensis]PFG41404.1 hypothetical protein ATJ88_0039 [Isoptericola jiangsuensis]